MTGRFAWKVTHRLKSSQFSFYWKIDPKVPNTWPIVVKNVATRFKKFLRQQWIVYSSHTVYSMPYFNPFIFHLMYNVSSRMCIIIISFKGCVAHEINYPEIVEFLRRHLTLVCHHHFSPPTIIKKIFYFCLRSFV